MRLIHLIRNTFVLLILSQSFLLAQNETCTVLKVYRLPQLSASMVSIRVFVNNEEVGRLVNNSSISINLEGEGTYEIAVQPTSRGQLYRIRTKKRISVQCNQEAYLLVKGGSALAETMLNVQDVALGAQGFAEIPSEKSFTINFTGASLTNPNMASNTFSPNNTATNNNESQSVPLTTSNTAQTQTINRSGGENITQPSTTTLNVKSGKSYALIIGINDYEDYKINDLDQPISDAQKLYDVLVANYTFESQNVKFLKNATKDEITKKLDEYFETLTDEDVLLIFYAGHGYWDEKFQQGYWITSDAQQNNRGTWLSNGTLRDYMRAIPSKHSLLITDACFGGGIFKSRSAFANSSVAINQLYKLPSRKAMTSGAMSEVPDKSVFIQYLVKRLQQNEDKYLSSEQLFASFKIAVINNSANGQVPQYGEVKETGDEGGDFIFIRK